MNSFKWLRYSFSIGLILLAILLPSQVVAAQDQGLQIRITQVDNSKFPQVTVYVSVTNAAGEPVGVDSSQIQLYEDGQLVQPQDVSGGGQGDIGSLTTMLVMDVSGSMDKAGKLDGAKQAAQAYVDQMRPGDQAGLMAFNTQVIYVQTLTADHEALTKAIDGLQTGGDTAMFDALVRAEQALQEVSGRKAIIALTDGLDNRSQSTAADVIAGIGPGGLSISTVGLGDPTETSQFGLDETTLKSLSEQAGGVYSFAKDPESLSALYKLYGRALQSEYRISYTSPNTLRDGVNRNLTASLTGGGASAQTKYNPGGVLPEVSARSWKLFGGILVGLALLLFVPMLVSRGAQTVGGGSGKSRIRFGKKKPRIKLK